MSEVQVKTDGPREVRLQLGGVCILVSLDTYQEFLEAAGLDLAQMHRRAASREAAALQQTLKAYAACKALRDILYENDAGEFFMLRERPDTAALDAFLEEHNALMGFAE